MILKEKTELSDIQAFEPAYFDDMVKIVIDRKRQIIAVHSEMHSDLGIELYDDGSDDEDLYGANIYYDDHSIEWSSTLNVARNREYGIRGRVLKDENLIIELTDIVNRWIYR